MSGIFGIVDPKRQSDIHVIAHNTSVAMSHREWFVAESFLDEETNGGLVGLVSGSSIKTPNVYGTRLVL